MSVFNTLMNILLFFWLITFALAAHFGDLRFIIVFGFLVIITQQQINLAEIRRRN